MNETKIPPFYYHILTFGCQMNKNDSERIESILQGIGLKSADDPKKADVIILNSCSVRESAEARIYGQVVNFAKLKKKNPNLVIAVTGCMPGRDKKNRFKSKLKNVDLYFPIKDIVLLPKWLKELRPEICNNDDIVEDYLRIRPTYSKPYQASVTIQTGCNQFCSYCVVPYARGAEVNRPVQDILDEVHSLKDGGCVELALLGQIINRYIAPDPENFSLSNPYKKNDFAGLLWELNQVKGINRIHWTAPHPLYMDKEVIDALQLPKQVNYIHLPVQSGNTEILKKMNRGYSREEYISVIEEIRKIRPGIAIGTDIIVGFCGETRQQFEDTVSLYKICDFDIAYIAQYSTRSGTVADKSFEDDVPKEEKKKRWRELQELMEKNTYEKNQKYIGSTVEVLVEECHNTLCSGKSREMKQVQFKGDESLVGKIVQVGINTAQEWILTDETKLIE